MIDTKLSLLKSISNYLENLEYLAKDDKVMNKDLMLCVIVDFVYDWGSWNNLPQEQQLTLQNIRKDILFNNHNLINYKVKTNDYYKNVNTPQDIYTWQRIYDDPSVRTYEILP